jgi:YD repeat-containing protein
MDPADPVPAPEDAAAVGITASAEFDGPTGRVSSRTDASGNTTTYEYDALSRIDRIGYPGGGEVTFDYAPSDPDYPYAVAHHSDEFNADTIDTATFVAGNGEVTGQKRDATFFVDRNSPTVTGWSVAGASLVDELGRTTRQWYPTQQLTGNLTDYWEATPPDLQPIRTEWDALDRVTKETAANDAVSTTAYGFDNLGGDRMSTIEQVDPLGRTTLTFKDAHDNVRAVDDIAVDLDPVRTTYQVDALGQLHSVRSSPTELIEHSYDLVGQRLSTTTPDGGRIEYEYDLSGNLITEQSSVLRADNDSKTHYSYEWGHLVETNYPDATPDVTFTWGGYGGVDPGDNGAGRVVGVVDAARDQMLGYDENGRVDSETTTMLGRHPNNGPWTTEFDYDFLGRLADVTLPDGETVINDYDAGAQLSSVRGEKACTDLGALTFAIDATQTSITVTENPTTGTPPLPFTIWIGSEQLEVTDRVATAFPDRWTYTVVRGVNGSPDAPTNTSHAAGASVTTDAELTCSYRYLDRREYDEFGSREFQSLGNDVWTEYTRNAETRRLEHQLTVSPAAPNEIQDLQYTYDLVGNLRVADNAVPADVPSLFGGPVHQEYE